MIYVSLTFVLKLVQVGEPLSLPGLVLVDDPGPRHALYAGSQEMTEQRRVQVCTVKKIFCMSSSLTMHRPTQSQPVQQS